MKTNNNDKDKDNIINRLRRIEGQVKGIQKMVDEEKCCSDILIQVAAARAALNKVGGIILQDHMKDCLKDSLKDDIDENVLDELIQIILSYTK